MGDNITDASYLLQFKPDDQITGYLKEIAQEAAKGITLEIDSDVSDVLKDIDKIAKALNDTMAQSGTFDFGKLFDLKTSLAKLGELSKTVGGVKEIFSSLNGTTDALAKSMTHIASLKLDAGQFSSIKDSLDKIDGTLSSISDKLAGIDDASGLKETKKQADAVGESLEKAAQKQEELNNAQANQPAKKKTVKDFSDEEIDKRISALEREKNRRKELASTVHQTKKLTEKDIEDITKQINKEQQAIEEASKRLVEFQGRLDKINTNKTLSNIYGENVKNLNYGVDTSKITKVKTTIKTITSEIEAAKAELNSTVDLYAKQGIQDNINYLERMKLDLQAIVDGNKGKGTYDKAAYDAEKQRLHALHEESERFYAGEIKQAQGAIKYNEDLITQKKELVKTLTNSINTAQQAQDQKEVAQAATEAGQAQVQANKESNLSLEEKLALIKNIQAELKFLETAEDKRISYEEKAYDVGGNNPKSEADSLKKIKMYEDLVEHIGAANAAVDSFQANYEELIITLNNGQRIKLNTDDLYDLTELKLLKSQIKDISFKSYDDTSVEQQVQTQKEVAKAAQESAQAQVNAQEKVQAETKETIALYKQFKAIYDACYDKHDINWATDEEGTANRLLARLKEIYSMRKNITQEARLEAAAILDISTGAGANVSAGLNKTQQKYFSAESFKEEYSLLLRMVDYYDRIEQEAVEAAQRQAAEQERVQKELEETNNKLLSVLAHLEEYNRLISVFSSGANVDAQTANNFERMNTSLASLATGSNTIESLRTQINALCKTPAELEQFNKVLAYLSTNMEAIQNKSLKMNVATPSQPMQGTADQAAAAAANTEALERQLAEATARAEALEHQMAEVNARAQQTVTGKVDIGNTVAITSDGGQLALEKTLKATYHIQQNMVKIMAEINSKMVSGAQAATASYEQLKAVMQETVETAKKLGAEEQKEAAKKGSGKSEYYTRLKQTYAEVLKIMKRLPQAGEKETAILERNLKNAKERIRYNQKQIKDRKLVNKAEEEIVQTLQKQLELQKAINEDKAAKVAKKAEKAVESASTSSSKTPKDPLASFKSSQGGFGKAFDANTSVIQTDSKVVELINHVRELNVAVATVDGKWDALSADTQKDILDTIEKLKSLKTNVNVFNDIKSGAYNVQGTGAHAGTFSPISQDQSALFRNTATSAAAYQQELERVAASLYGTSIQTKSYDEVAKQLTFTYEDQEKNLREMTIYYDRAADGARSLQTAMSPYKSVVKDLLSPIGKKMKELMTYFSSFMVIMRAINFVKEGVSTIRELNTALTELKVVTGESSAAIEKFEKSAQKVASSIASTTLEVTKSATEWGRLGYSMEDSLELAMEAAKYSKVGFTDIGVATENLTATLQAFYADDIKKGIISAGDAAAEITDKLVFVGNKFASSAEGMGQGITAAGAALVAANNSLDESLAMITAGIVCLRCTETHIYRTRQIALSA